MSTDLVAFIEARLEALARNADDIHSRHCALYAWLLRPEDSRSCDCGIPAHVRADAKAKRVILAEHRIEYCLSEYAQSWGNGHSYGCVLCHDHDGITTGRGYCTTLLALAAPFEADAGFWPEWKIES